MAVSTRSNLDAALGPAVVLIQRFEGFSSKPYLDSVGIATIGWGTTVYPNGVSVTLGDPEISQEEALGLLKYHVATQVLPKLVKALPQASKGSYTGTISFCYNLGTGAFLSSTFRRRLIEGLIDQAKLECLKWCKAGGLVLRGLLRRRQAEAEMLGS